jgi:hypothetical protein
LRIDSAQIDVVEVTTRQMDDVVIACLNQSGGSGELWEDLDEVQSVTLAVQGKRYHYIVLQELTIYCSK